jgi:two-component sensor histidine kinase
MAVALRENRPVRGREAIAERPDGSRVSFMPYPTPLHDASGALVGAVNMLVDITHRKADETAQQTHLQRMARELDHRANNMLATIQALARMTRAETVDAYVNTFLGRITAVSRAHALLAESHWRGAELRRLVEEELAAFDGGGRVLLDGPAVTLRPETAQSFVMVVHELATNAARHGALSRKEGRVGIAWTVSADAEVRLVWHEHDGPAVTPPACHGFGLKLVESAVRGQLGGTITLAWETGGLRCTLDLPIVAGFSG